VIALGSYAGLNERDLKRSNVERLRALIGSHAAAPLPTIETQVFDAVRAHGMQLDDQTLLLIRVQRERAEA
jgi:hypothetical protein